MGRWNIQPTRLTGQPGGEQISAETQVAQNATYYAHWTPLVADWPEDTSTVASQTAAEAFYIVGDLANVNAKTLADWAKGVGNVDFADRNSINADAYLLNIANDSTAEAIAASAATASAEIKITAITVAGGVPQLTYRKTYGNGKVVLRGSATIGASASWHDGRLANDRFFKAVLRLK